MKPEEFFQDVQEENIAFQAAEEEALNARSLKLAVDEVLRIEEPVTANWSGVSGCCDQSTVDSNANTAYINWVKSKMYEYRHLKWLRYGAGPGKGKCSRSKDPWTGVRSCRGYITMTCYIEFSKP